MTQTHRNEVVLVPVQRGPMSGYQARLVSDETCEWTGEVVRTEIGPRGPWSDALLVARSRGAEWAERHGYRLAHGY